MNMDFVVPAPDEQLERLLWDLHLQRLESQERLIWAGSPDEWDAAIEVRDRHLNIGQLRYRWDSPSAAEPECEVANEICLDDLPADREHALARLGPLVAAQRKRYRKMFFRCRNCQQELPPSARSESAPARQALCEPCALARGYEQLIH